MSSARQYAAQLALDLILLLDFISTGETGSMMARPQNTVALVGDSVVMRCAAGGGRRVRWTHDGSSRPCSQKRDHCDVEIDSVQTSDAGAYDCMDGGSRPAQASLVVIDAMPVCEAEHTPVMSGELNSVTCRFNYTRYNRIQPGGAMTSSVTWPGDKSGYFRSDQTNSGRAGTVSATVPNVTVNAEGIPTFNWIAQFSFRARSMSKDYASNSAALRFNNSLIPVWRCPTSVFVTTSARSYTAGSVLTCTSDGHSAPTHYSWTDPASGELVGSGRDVTLDGPLFSLTCTATAEFSGAVGPCSAALTVGNSQPSTTSTSTDSDTQLLMLVLVIIFGVLLCLSLIAVIVLAVWLHVLRTRSTTKPPDPPPTPRRPAPNADENDYQAGNHYHGLEGYVPDTTPRVYTRMYSDASNDGYQSGPYYEAPSPPAQQRRGTTGANGAPRVLPRPKEQRPTTEYLTVIG